MMMSIPRKTSVTVVLVLTCCCSVGFQRASVTGALDPEPSQSYMAGLDEWKELEAQYGPAEQWGDGVGPERPRACLEPPHIQLNGIERSPSKSFWADPFWWSESVFRPLGIDFNAQKGVNDPRSSCDPDGTCG